MYGDLPEIKARCSEIFRYTENSANLLKASLSFFARLAIFGNYSIAAKNRRCAKVCVYREVEVVQDTKCGRRKLVTVGCVVVTRDAPSERPGLRVRVTLSVCLSVVWTEMVGI